MDELGGQVRALGHSQVSAHAQGSAVAAPQQLQLQAKLCGDGGGAVGQGLGGHLVGGSRNQFPGQFDATAEAIETAEQLGTGLGEAQELHRCGQGLGFGVAFEALVVEQAQSHGLGNGRCGRLGFQALHR